MTESFRAFVAQTADGTHRRGVMDVPRAWLPDTGTGHFSLTLVKRRMRSLNICFEMIQARGRIANAAAASRSYGFSR